jgi:hypothetical protein
MAKFGCIDAWDGDRAGPAVLGGVAKGHEVAAFCRLRASHVSMTKVASALAGFIARSLSEK